MAVDLNLAHKVMHAILPAVFAEGIGIWDRRLLAKSMVESYIWAM